jgi:RNA polymerase sigma-70 factor (ECF subfamily)
MDAVAQPGRVAAGDDARLVLRLRAGERGAFDDLYERHAARIYGFLYRLSGRRDLADDLSQEHWLRVARHAGQLREDTDLSAWLFTIARNLYRSHQRFAIFDWLRRRDSIEADHVPTPERTAASRQALSDVERAMSIIAPAHREILLLVGVEEMEPSRAASVLGIRPEAARQRLARARAELAAALERQHKKKDNPEGP